MGKHVDLLTEYFQCWICGKSKKNGFTAIDGIETYSFSCRHCQASNYIFPRFKELKRTTRGRRIFQGINPLQVEVTYTVTFPHGNVNMDLSL